MTPSRQPKTGDLKALTVRLPPPLHALIKAKAEADDLTMGAIVTEVLEAWAGLGGGAAPTASTDERQLRGPSEAGSHTDHSRHNVVTTGYGTFCKTCEVRLR